MNRAILFRYHDHKEVCEERLALLRRLNSEMPIWGLYGGPKPEPLTLKGLDANYKVPFEEARFKWEHGDLCVRAWFKDMGHSFTFDILHIIEWDLLLLAPIAELMGHVKDGIALTNMEMLSHHKEHGWGWIALPERQKQFAELKGIIQKRYAVTLDLDTLKAGPFGGACLSRAFLERYATEDVPVLLHDEIRTSAFATAFGMNVHETGLAARATFWNCEKDYYTAEKVLTSGGIVFHPVKELLDINLDTPLSLPIQTSRQHP